jgi:hypothetical protein
MATVQIPLASRHGIIRCYAIVADDDFSRENLIVCRWNFDGHYATRSVTDSGRQRKVYLHRLVFTHYHGALPIGAGVDHIDKDPMNNTPSNLRLSNQSLNTANGRLSRANTSGFKGVTRASRKTITMWTAQVMVHYRHLHLGCYKTPREAADAVNDAYRKYFPDVDIPNP